MGSFSLVEKLEKCRRIHNDKYDYSLVDYKHSKTKVKIICHIHGVFEQAITKHEKGGGCTQCGHIKKAHNRSLPSQLSFVLRAKEKHPEFDYSKTMYTRVRNKVTITCPVHGDWDTDPTKFLISVVGCPECSRLIMVQLNREKTFGWEKETWIKKGLKAKKFQSFKCYVIKCWNEEETFYKIGKTFNRIKKRFSCKEDMPYKFEVMHLFEYQDGGEAHDKEESLKILNKKNQYTPKIYFSGMYECYKHINLS